MNKKIKIRPHETTEPFILKYQYEGWLGNDNSPKIVGTNYVFQSLMKIEIMHICSN